MTRYDLYTASIGIISVFFALAIYYGSLPTYAKFFLLIFGVLIFLHSAYTLYRSLADANFYDELADKYSQSDAISRISLLNQKGEIISSWELYGKVSAVIGKDVGENQVDIDLSEDPYASMIDVQHAVLNFADGNWYVEDLDSQNGISIKKIGQEQVYKLSSLQPCKLDFGDIIFVGMCQLKVN